VTHKTKFCFERPRKVGAKYTNEDIKPDDIIVNIEIDYDGKRDRWNGYNPDEYVDVIKEHELFEQEKKKKLKNADGLGIPQDQIDDDYK